MREMRTEEDRGFTLIELLVVVVIIGILIAIAIPLYLNYEKGAQNKSAASDLRGAIATLEQCYTDAGSSYPTAVTAGTGSYSLSNCGTASAVINTSSGNAITYVPNSTTAGSSTAYIVTSIHTGNGTWYCYGSTNGGSVKTEPSTATIPTAFGTGACP
jgi:type IV pilus assembly protein PilA